MANWREADYYPKLREAKVDPKDLEFFRSEPLTKKWFEDPQYSPIVTAARISVIDKEDEFLGKTLKTDDTIKHWLALVSNISSPLPGAAIPIDESTKISRAETTEVLIFFHLESGVNGFRETAHGGLLCTLMDEALAMVVELYRATSSSSREELYTARLNISYRRPVRTPGTFVAKSWLEKREGRKWIVRGLLENSDGEICVEVDGLWIGAAPGRL
jgi:acyl-coenzyme A thioesterase PaaI-like protein